MNLFQDYLAQSENLRSFVTAFPGRDQDLLTAAEARKQFPLQRDLLADVLKSQNAGLPGNEAVLRNIELLRSPVTYTVTTGHQLCLAGGPMFTLYKIITAIRLAAHLQEKLNENGRASNVIPVFWMASEDHDFEEVNHYFSSFTEKHTYTGTFTGAAGRHRLEDSVTETLAHASETARRFFVPGISLSQAFRGFIHELFGEHGLIVMDPDCRELKSLFAPVAERELFQKTVSRALGESSAALEAMGYEAQIHPREINLFWLGETRERILSDGDDFALADSGRKISASEMRTALAETPEKISPNVALRPVYQCMLLPDLCMTGGPGEIAYWLQLKSTFDSFSVPFPVLVPRMRAALISEADADQLRAASIDPQDLAKPWPELADLRLNLLWSDASLRNQMAEVLSQFESLAAMVDKLDPTQGMAMKAETAKLKNALDERLKKLRKSARQKFNREFRDLEALKNKIYPDQTVQERTLNVCAFLRPEINERQLIQLISDHYKPFHTAETWITLP